MAADNSYVTLEEAEEFIPNILPGDPWSLLSDNEKVQTLISATSLLDLRYAPFLSEASDKTQSLAFPRKTFTYYDEVLGVFVKNESPDIPPRVKKATMWIAAHLAANEESLFGARNQRNWTSISLEGMSLSDGTADTSSANRPPLFPTEAALLMRPFRRAAGASPGNTWWRSN